MPNGNYDEQTRRDGSFNHILIHTLGSTMSVRYFVRNDVGKQSDFCVKSDIAEFG